jgi:hypothetical protein
LLGFGTWTAYGGGKVLVGYLSGDPLFGTGGGLNGSANSAIITHTHATTASNASHSHTATVSDPGHAHNLKVSGDGSVGSAGVKRNNATDSPTGSGGYVVSSGVNGTGISVGLDSQTPVITVTTPAPVGAVAGTNQNYQPSITVYMWRRDS